MASAEESIYARLSADAAVTALVGNRIYPNQIPPYDSEATPWLYYTVTDSEPVPGLNGSSGVAKHTFVFDCLADDYATARAIADAVRSSLDQWAGGQVQRALWTGESTEVLQFGYHLESTFSVWATDAAIVPTEAGLPRVEVRADGLYFGGARVGQPVVQAPAGTTTGYVGYEWRTGAGRTAMRIIFGDGPGFDDITTRLQFYRASDGSLQGEMGFVNGFAGVSFTSSVNFLSFDPVLIRGGIQVGNYADAQFSGRITSYASRDLVLHAQTGFDNIATASGAANHAMSMQAAAGQTADIAPVLDSNGATIAGIDALGAWRPVALADAAAFNGTLYYSTTAGKLVFKDAAGVVNPLY